MKKVGIVLAAVAVVALPATAVAKPNKADKRHASKECRAERDAMGVENFKALYGNFGKCVSQHAREENAERKAAKRNAVQDCKAQGKKGRELGQCVKTEAKENKAEADAEDQAEVNAAETCRAEQETIGEEAFAEKYGTNANKKNAFGKCVSGIAKEQGGDDEGDDEQAEGDEPKDGGQPDDTGKPENPGQPA